MKSRVRRLVRSSEFPPKADPPLAGVVRSMVCGLFVLLATSNWQLATVFAGELADRDPVTISVVAVNPSVEKTQVIPIKIELPKEVTPKDVLNSGELKIEYDDKQGAYYVFKKEVELAPKETRVFRVTMRDLWYIPGSELDPLRDYTHLLMEKLAGSPYKATAQNIGKGILSKLKEIRIDQEDDTLSRKAHIGAYRLNRQAIERIKEDLVRMEKLISFTGGVPVPEMLEESPLKSDAPSATTTWLVILLIIVFIGLLGGQFFFTWQRKNKATAASGATEGVFPSSRQGEEPGSKAA